MHPMKRWLKVLLALAAAVVAVATGAVVALQVPAVQKAICDKVTKSVSEKTGLDLQVGDIHFALFDRVILDDVVLANGKDTILVCNKASAAVSPLKLLKGDIKINRVNLDGGRLYPSNFPKAVKDATEKDDPDGEDKPFSLPKVNASVGHIVLNDFKVVNYNPGGKHVNRSQDPRQVDFNDLNVTDLHVDIKDVKYDGYTASLKLNDISFKEQNSGFALDKLSLKADYDSTGLHIADFKFKDKYSDLSLPEANLNFKDFKDFEHFQDSVSFDASIKNSKLDLRSIQALAEKTSFLELKLLIDGKVEGKLSDLRTESLKVWSGTKETFLDLSAHLSGLPDADHTMASIKVNRSYTNTKDIAEIVYQCTDNKASFDKKSISHLAPGEQLSFTGSLNGFFEDFVVYGAVKSNLGGCNVDLMCRSDGTKAYEVLGYADLNEFDLGRFLQVDGLGKATCHASASGIFAANPKDTEYYIDEINIPKFEFNGYSYSNISGNGNWRQNEFEGRIVSADPNLKFMLQGILAPSSSGSSLYHMKLSLGHADLAALGFDKREISNIRLNAEADVTQTPDGRIMGKVDLKDIQCKSADGTFDLDDIEVISLNGKERYMLGVNSGMVTARYRGDVFVTDIIPQLEGMVMLGKLDNLARRMKKMPVPCTDKFDLSVRTGDLKGLLGYLAPGIHIENGTSVSVKSKGDSTGAVSLKSPLLALNNIYVQDLSGKFDFQKTSSSGKLSTQMIRIGDVSLADGVLKADCAGNSALADFSYCNDPDSLDSGHLKAMFSFPNLKEGNQKMLVHLGHSYVRLGGDQWNIDPSSVYYADKHITINDFNLYNKDQGLGINGILSGSSADTCSFDIRNLDLALANLLMKEPLNISGTLTGDGKVIGVFSHPEIFGDVAVDSLSLAGQMIGRIEAHTNYDDTLHRVNLNARNILNDEQVLTAAGHYDSAKETINATVSAKRFNVGVVEPFLTGLASDVSGTLTADALITGKLNAPDITVKGGRLEKFCAKLDYTQVPYTLDGFVDVNSKAITLRDFNIKDQEKGTGTLSGVITHDHFKDFNLGLNIKANNILGFDTSFNDNETFYGKAYASGTVGINGPINALNLNIDVATRPVSVVNIPIRSASTSQSSILTFVDHRPSVRLSTIDSLINLGRVKEKAEERASGGGLNVFARVRANENAKLNLELDSDAGDALRVSGNGIVDISVKDGEFNITGDYTVSEGQYALAMLGLVNREFTLDPGSTIHFNGDIMQSELNMTASYKTKASISPLMAAGSENSVRRPVNCNIKITDKLTNPSLGFDIKIDDLDPTIQALIEGTLNTEEKRMRQFLALILSGSFIPDEQSGIVNNTSVSYFNATEIMSTQLNNILQQLGIPIDFGFNYQPTDTGQDLFDVAISTQLLNNRISVNGNIGNRRYMTSNRDDIVGDIDVEVKLDRRGKTRLKLFSHSADEYSNYLDQTQRNGVGVSYKEEFDSFGDLFKKKPRKKRDAPVEETSPVTPAAE